MRMTGPVLSGPLPFTRPYTSSYVRYISHLKSFRFVPADGSPVKGASSALWAVLMTLWHGLQLAYRPRTPIFNRLLHRGSYVVLNLPGVRMR